MPQRQTLGVCPVSEPAWGCIVSQTSLHADVVLSLANSHVFTLPRRRCLAWLGAAGLGAGGAPAQAALPPGPALAWPTVRLLDGRTLGPAEWAGTAGVVVFFSLTCTYCHRHNQRLQKLAERCAGQPLRVLGAAHDGSAQQVREHLATHGLRFGVTQEAAVLHALLSPRRITPLTCVVDRAGRLREIIPGEMSEDDVLGLARWAAPAEQAPA